MLGYADAVGLPVHVLLTKADKLKRGQAAKAMLEVRKELGDSATVQQFSALNRQGEDEAPAPGSTDPPARRDATAGSQRTPPHRARGSVRPG